MNLAAPQLFIFHSYTFIYSPTFLYNPRFNKALVAFLNYLVAC
ncbi:hypothetical protein PLUTE_a4609 [Pseudoalteromonas luteoviolacea DSM 6061]|nr:hypothetical protein [Pseudoalteromonas luteoviolacea DSM 6061]